MKKQQETEAIIKKHLHKICVSIGERPVGSENNKRTGQYIADNFNQYGFEVEKQRFDCLDWQDLHTELLFENKNLPVRANFLSPACNLAAALVSVGSVEEMEACGDVKGKILLLHGELSKETLMPKGFVFYNPDEHKRIYRFMESAGPAAVLTVCPNRDKIEPTIQDGDFHIPSATVPPDVGKLLLNHGEKPVNLTIRSRRQESTGYNVIARKESKTGTGKKVMICAHYDTVWNTPGALDNGGGTAVLLALANGFSNRNLEFDLELVAFNGEDYYSVPGQMAYIEKFEKEFPQLSLVINIDGVGLKDVSNSIAYFECPEKWVAEVEQLRKIFSGTEPIEPWPQGDHSIFAMRGIPSLAFSSKSITSIIGSIFHTEADTIDKIDPAKIAEVVHFIKRILLLAKPQ